MLNESKTTVKVMASVRTRFPDSLVTKHADRATGNIPDFDVCTSGLTLWVEMKYLKKGDTLAEKCGESQIIKGHQRFVATHGKCLYVIFDNRKGVVGIWTPQALFRHLKPALAGPAPGSKTLGCNPFLMSQLQFDQARKGLLRELWEGRGAIEIKVSTGLYHVVSRMLEEFLG